jgi:hypothetical protein
MNDHESGGGASLRLDQRVALLLAAPGIRERLAPRPSVIWPVPGHPEPPDLAALYRGCDGLATGDGVVLRGKGELHDLTQWVVLDRGLSWPDDMVVVGERDDAIVVCDLDVANERAGGGVLEVVTDDLGSFTRVASDLVAYAALHARAPAPADPAPPPEVLAREALEARDAGALEAALSRPLYPGSERLLGSLALGLGGLYAERGNERAAIAAFERAVAARSLSVGPGARKAEEAAAWRAASRASRSGPLVAYCEKRATERRG